MTVGSGQHLKVAEQGLHHFLFHVTLLCQLCHSNNAVPPLSLTLLPANNDNLSKDDDQQNNVQECEQNVVKKTMPKPYVGTTMSEQTMPN